MKNEIEKPLSEKESAFCLHVAQTENAAEAYRLHMSGGKCSMASAKVSASRLLSKPHIQARLAEIRQEAKARHIERGGDLLAYAIDVLIDITNKGREMFKTAEGIEQYHSLPAARAAASELAKIHLADNDTTIKLTRIKILHELKAKGLMNQRQLERLTDEVIGDRP